MTDRLLGHKTSAALNFLLPAAQKPIFGNNRVEVTRKAADIFAKLFRQIIARGQDRARAQRFILQLLVSVVAEDNGIFPTRARQWILQWTSALPKTTLRSCN